MSRLDISKKSDIKHSIINDKLARCEEFKQGYYGKVSYSYTENSPKEELVLEHVMQYQRQFKIAYDNERELFLYPPNECHVYKFICTTIRPTKMGYLELYDYQKAAKFISNFIQYEELDPPNKYPEIIPSPTNVLTWQKGDSFDMAILLVSILIGTGYDAYVVVGEADYLITSKNETYMPYEKIDYEGLEGLLEEEMVQEEVEQASEFKLDKKPPIISKFDAELDERIRTQEQIKELKSKTIDDEAPEKLAKDPYEGQRKHAWVLLKGSTRGVERDIFIEPSTGKIYPLDSEYYYYVDAIFNNKNYWINMKPNTPTEDLKYDFEKPEAINDWEYVMLDTLADITDLGLEIPDEDIDQNPPNLENLSDELKDVAQTLDMPPPWPPKIVLEYDAYHQGSPLGEGMVYYSKCTVEIFAEYSQVDGLVKRITVYQDYKRILIKEIRYIFKHRIDKLRVRRRFPFEFKTIEYYDPNVPHNWKKVTEIDRESREIIFYPNRNVDGLIKRKEIIGTKTMEYYQNRDDKVIYRSIRFRPGKNHDEVYWMKDNHIGEVTITKMTQKFEKNPYIPAMEQIAKMVVNISSDHDQNNIVITYHLEEGQIYPLISEYKRDDIKQGKLETDKRSQDTEEQRMFKKIHDYEKECYTNMKTQEGAAFTEMDEKQKREEKINDYRQSSAIDEAKKDILEKTLYDKAKEKRKHAAKNKIDEESDNINSKDKVTALLAREGLLKKPQLDFKEAVEIRKKIMDKLKERILDRANIIQKRLEKEKENLAKEEANARKAVGGRADEEKIEERIKKLQFKILILDQRATKFEVQALQEYAKMDEYLNNHEKLSILKTGKPTGS